MMIHDFHGNPLTEDQVPTFQGRKWPHSYNIKTDALSLIDQKEIELRDLTSMAYGKLRENIIKVHLEYREKVTELLKEASHAQGLD